MKTTASFNGRDWPGSLCRFCGHFIPDVLSVHCDIICEGCGTSLGVRAFDRYWHDLDEEKVQAVLKAEQDRALQAKLRIDQLIAHLVTEKDELLAAATGAEIKRRLAENLHVPRDFKLQPSWQARHAELVRGHFCLDCHRKRRDAGTDFADVHTYATHEIRCSVCKKTVAYLHVAEHHHPDEHQKAVEWSSMDCMGSCADQAAAMVLAIRKSVTADPPANP